MTRVDPIPSANILRYGTSEPPPEQKHLRAGPLSLMYEAGDLRYIRLGDREILRRVYVAVRDPNWGTVPAVLHNVELAIEQDSFRITYEAEHRQGAIDFRWRATISGDARGTISFRMDGLAHSTFQRNRIGFCVLHPSASAGAACVVEHVDGTSETARLPQRLSADQPLLPFAELRAITEHVGPDVRATVRFEGDSFEMEDQRNWTDASFKTFCTPLRLPYPVEVPAGTRVTQSVTLSLEATGELPAREDPSAPLRFTVGIASAPLPSIGLGVASHAGQLSERELARLGALQLSHLRVDLRLADPAWQQRLAQAIDETRTLDLALELAVLLSVDDEPALRRLQEVLAQERPRLCRCLIYPARESPREAPPLRSLIALARRYLGNTSAPIGAGTNSDFFLLNRHGVPLGELDLLAFAINPQAHAFDSASLVETLQAQAAVVSEARHMAGARPVAVSPVTLKPRFNPYAGAMAEQAQDGVPPEVDPRQMSLFGAGWTVGSLKYLAEGSSASVTYYETTGRRGMMDSLDAPSAAEWFRSPAGAVFPLYHVLADVGEWGGSVIQSMSSSPLLVDGFVLRNGEQLRILLANLRNEPQEVIVAPIGPQANVRLLDQDNALAAMEQPEQFRAATAERRTVAAGRLSLVLQPYAVARIDTTAAPDSDDIQHERTA